MSSKPIPAAPALPSFRPVALGLFLTVFFGRAWLIKLWGSAAPHMDEWDAFARLLYRPWLDGSLSWRDIFAAHNEHRIALTRLADLALFILNGGWNPWGQLLLNAALHALTAATILALGWRALAPSGRIILTGALALLFTSTSGWQNALWGFQSQFYFCNLLSLLALAGLLLAPAFSRGWLLGWFAAFLALFSTGGGLLASLTVLAAGIFSLGLGVGTGSWRELPKKALPVLAIVPLVLLGGLLRVEVPAHVGLQAHSPGIFFAAFFRCLSWPWIDQPWAGLLLQAPLLLFAGQLVRARRQPAPFDLFLIGLGALGVIHAAAIAWSRGAGLPDSIPSSRYLDVQLYAMVANVVLLLRWSVPSRNARLAALAWTGFALAGLLALTTENLSQNLLLRGAQGRAGLEQIRRYLTTHDPAALHPEVKAFELHPNPEVVRQVLDDPVLRPVLPRDFTDPAAGPPWPIRFAPGLMLLSLVGTGLACRLAIRAKSADPAQPG